MPAKTQTRVTSGFGKLEIISWSYQEWLRKVGRHLEWVENRWKRKKLVFQEILPWKKANTKTCLHANGYDPREMDERRKTAGLTFLRKWRWADWVRVDTNFGPWSMGTGTGRWWSGWCERREWCWLPLFTGVSRMGGVECTQQESWEKVLSNHFKE